MRRAGVLLLLSLTLAGSLWAVRGDDAPGPGGGGLAETAVATETPAASPTATPSPAPPVVDPSPPPAATPPGDGPLAAIVERGLRRDSQGKVTEAFGFDAASARGILYPVNKSRALPPGYTPTDLVSPDTFGLEGIQPVRSIIGPDLAEMNRASEYALVVASGYRSYDYQRSVFESEVLAKVRAGMGRAEAEARANAESAQAGHSEHQLGTTIDFNLIEESFAGTPAGRWLAANSWRYGFVMSYTPKATERSGYVFEPWHFRWVGRPLARLLHEQDYLESEIPLSDYLEAIWAALED
ncbi:MAG: M15 family metallopeptidase [Chloroflexi bacterium]|nr:M15 family metallopeptidase [Chloroflexota bacterium]